MIEAFALRYIPDIYQYTTIRHVNNVCTRSHVCTYLHCEFV